MPSTQLDGIFVHGNVDVTMSGGWRWRIFHGASDNFHPRDFQAYSLAGLALFRLSFSFSLSLRIFFFEIFEHKLWSRSAASTWHMAGIVMDSGISQQHAQLKSQSFFLSIFPLTMFKLCKCRKKKEKKKFCDDEPICNLIRWKLCVLATRRDGYVMTFAGNCSRSCLAFHLMMCTTQSRNKTIFNCLNEAKKKTRRKSLSKKCWKTKKNYCVWRRVENKKRMLIMGHTKWGNVPSKKSVDMKEMKNSFFLSSRRWGKIKGKKKFPSVFDTDRRR